VFFASQCGKKGDYSHSRTALGIEDENDRRLFSLGAAVEFARANNLLGVFVDADLLVKSLFNFVGSFAHSKLNQIQVPSLIQSIRNVGLLVGVHGVLEKSTPLTTAGLDGCPVDAFLDDGMVVYLDYSTREVT
jgi:CDK inhibitor PHO81